MLDTAIIGTGPAGLTAGIYASCYRMQAVVIGKLAGGEMTKATKIINYPGQEPITGEALTQKMIAQLKFLGMGLIEDSVVTLEKIDGGFRLTTEQKQTFDAKTVIVATGTERRMLGVAGEREFMGKGVFYCATCDASYYDDKVVAVVGGSNAAVQAAVLLAERSKQVYIIYRGAVLRADQIWNDEIAKHPKIEVIYGTNVTTIGGDAWVKNVTLDVPYHESATLVVDGVFVEIGGTPGTALLVPLGVELDEKGFIKINTTMETTVPGIYAAGDCTVTGNMLQQISVAVGEGAKAAGFVYKSLRSIRPPALWGKMWTNS